MVRVDTTGSRTERKEGVRRLVGGNRPFPRTGSVDTEMPYITCLRAAKYFDGLGLHVPKRAIPSHQAGDILEVKVVRCARPGVEIALYTRHMPGSKRAMLDLRQLSVDYGEEFWVTGIRPYPVGSFAGDYNASKPDGLENTALRWYKGLRMIVDGDEFAMDEVEMSHFKGGVSIRAGFGDSGPVKITKMIGGFSMRLHDHPLVKSMRADGGCVAAMYKFPGENVRNRLMRPAPLQRPLGSGRLPRFKACVEVLSRPDSLEGEYKAKVRPRLILHIARRLANHTFRGYTNERGDIGEELIDAILSNAGCPQVMSHPLDPGREFDSSRKGPDSLRKITNGTLAYFEFKWWQDADDAIQAAAKQARDYLTRYEDWRGERVTGAYIAVLNWNHVASIMTLEIRIFRV